MIPAKQSRTARVAEEEMPFEAELDDIVIETDDPHTPTEGNSPEGSPNSALNEPENLPQETRVVDRILNLLPSIFSKRTVEEKTDTKEVTSSIKTMVKDWLGIEEFDRYHIIIAVVVMVLLVIALIFPFMLTSMPDTELGVGYSPLLTRFQDSIIPSGGVRKKIWAGKVIKWPRTEQILDFTSASDAKDEEITDNNSHHIRHLPHVTCNSKDGLLIQLYFNVHLKVDESKLLFLTRNYKTFNNWFTHLATQVRSSVLNSCAVISANDFQLQRGNIASIIEETVKTALYVRYRAEVIRLNLIH